VLTFIGNGNTWFELDVVGYQFPDAELDGWDSEWLRFAGVVSCDRGKWEFSDPCLTTFELKALADWLRSSPNEASGKAIGFIEPNLSFARAGLAEGLVISFAQESAPPWATEQEKYGEGFSIAFSIDLNNCHSFGDRHREDSRTISGASTASRLSVPAIRAQQAPSGQ
jgi:hypothetical protein